MACVLRVCTASGLPADYLRCITSIPCLYGSQGTIAAWQLPLREFTEVCVCARAYACKFTQERWCGCVREASTNLSPVSCSGVSVRAQFSVEEVMGRAEVDPRDGRVHAMRVKSAFLRLLLSACALLSSRLPGTARQA